MNVPTRSTLTWNELTRPSMSGEDVLITYPVEGSSIPIMRHVNIIGTSYIENTRCLLVSYDDDTYIILKDGKGKLWEAYFEFDQ